MQQDIVDGVRRSRRPRRNVRSSSLSHGPTAEVPTLVLVGLTTVAVNVLDGPPNEDICAAMFTRMHDGCRHAFTFHPGLDLWPRFGRLTENALVFTLDPDDGHECATCQLEVQYGNGTGLDRTPDSIVEALYLTEPPALPWVARYKVRCPW